MEQNILKSWLNGDLDKYADNNDEVYNILENPTKTKINTDLYDLGFNDCLKILRLINNKRQEIGLPGFNDFTLPFKDIKHQLTGEEKLLIELENYTKKILVYQKDLGDSYITGYYDCLSSWNYKDEACSYVLGCVISEKPVVNPEDIITEPSYNKKTEEDVLRIVEEAKQKLLDVIKKLENENITTKRI
jgi:hypothetical protein